ncbi:MAG: tRNA 2-thiouridine(34) synthase MnmA [Clostridia bacterium]|nr:tRNA 2-thiouridine(34) synthase MnmA [Clostridia bacterium]
MSKILVAMSGGVDSSAALSILLDEGHTLSGITFVIDDSEAGSLAVRDAAEVARRLGIPHEKLDISEVFRRQVKEYFVRSYEAGETPNPCVVCNREIKFGLLCDLAAERGFDGVATGHYVRKTVSDGRVCLMRAADERKDQSYMLAHVPEASLLNAVFPLGGYTKDEIRRIAADTGLSVADKKDSQDICFVPDGDYVGFLTRYRGREPDGGDYVDPDGRVLGRHMGQECYTIGQRKGLGIALGRHMFVLDKNAKSNTVTLGDSDALMKREIILRCVNLIGRDRICDGERLDVKIRYAHRAAPAELFNVDGGLRVVFGTPQRAPSPGQLAVMYAGDVVFGGGIICGSAK